jgi:hypothetical protein
VLFLWYPRETAENTKKEEGFDTLLWKKNEKTKNIPLYYLIMREFSSLEAIYLLYSALICQEPGLNW